MKGAICPQSLRNRRIAGTPPPPLRGSGEPGLIPAILFEVEGNVEKRKLLLATAPVIFALAAACSAASGDERAGGGRDSGSGDEVSVTGCLTAGPDGRFALTAAPDAGVTATSRAMDDERDTHSYVLLGGDNLGAHLGKRVEVTGTVSGKMQEVEQDSTKETQTAPAGRRDDRPEVKTKEEIDLEVRQLNVRQVRAVAPTCEVK